MDNLINVFMNYKINRLIKYGTYIYDDDSDFVSKCFKAYFRTYVDNYYYGVFNTIEENVYNQRNLKLEFKGIKEEMLADYAGYELQVGNLEYVENRKIISELLDIAIEITKIDQLNYKDKDDIDSVVEKFISGVALLNDLVGKRLNKLISLVKETYSNTNKLLNMKDNYFSIEKLSFIKENNIKYTETIKNIFKTFIPGGIMVLFLGLINYFLPFNELTVLGAILTSLIDALIGGIIYLIISYKMGLIEHIFGIEMLNKIIKKLTLGKLSIKN